jgi:hypothetical protein
LNYPLRNRALKPFLENGMTIWEQLRREAPRADEPCSITLPRRMWGQIVVAMIGEAAAHPEIGDLEETAAALAKAYDADFPPPQKSRG